MSEDRYRQPRHPIRIVMERTGLSLETLRAWERRYGAVRPERTEGAQRRYSDADIERLRLLTRVVAGGRAVGQVAALSGEELAALAREDEGAAPARSGDAGRWEFVLEAARAAVLELDATRLERALRQGALLAGAAAFVESVAVPLLRWLGSGWADGTLTVAHEHLASAVLRRALGTLLSDAAAPPGAPVFLCATPAGQVHEFGVLLAAVTASSFGWRTVYLGADLPARDIASAARSTGASAVALSVVYPSDDPALPGELRELRAQLGPGPRILLGGSGARVLRAMLPELAIEPIGGLAELEAALSLSLSDRT